MARLIRRIGEELFCFPLFVFALVATPLILLDIKDKNRKLMDSHRRVVRVFARHRALRKLLRHALSLDIRFSIHQKDVERKIIGWWIAYPPPRPRARPVRVLAGKYLDFLSSLCETRTYPIISVQMDRKGRIKPSRTIKRLYFLSHELGHLARHKKGLDRCSWGEQRDCLYDELSATLEGMKTLKNLSYGLDFPAFARYQLKAEFSTMRCSHCIDSAPCRAMLDQFFSFPSREKPPGWAVDPSKFLEKVKDL